MSAEVIFATSFDEKYPPTNILNSSNGMFWASTGLYPQEIVLSLAQARPIKEIAIQCYNIKKLQIESCENDSAVKFVVQSEMSNIANRNGLQQVTCKFNSNANNKILKIVILEGHKEFCTINSISIN